MIGSARQVPGAKPDMITHPIRVLSVIPPMTQLNTPYPSTAYLTGFLRSRGIDAVQEDLALTLVLKLFSADGLLAIRECTEAIPKRKRSAIVNAFHRQFDRYLSTITPAIAFLQGRDPTLAHRICGRQFLPEGPRFKPLDVLSPRRQRRPAGLGLRRTRNAGPRQTFGHPVPERHRRRAARRGRSAFRVRPLRRIAGAEPADLRAARRSSGRATQSGRQHAARSDAGRAGTPLTETGAALGAVPRLGLCGVPHRADDQGARPIDRHRARRRLSSTPSCAN